VAGASTADVLLLLSSGATGAILMALGEGPFRTKELTERELACDPQSPTELAEGEHGLSYHQVNRRAGLFKTAGLVCEVPTPGQQRCYALTDQTRRSTGLIAGIGRWRQLWTAPSSSVSAQTASPVGTSVWSAAVLPSYTRSCGRRSRTPCWGDRTECGFHRPTPCKPGLQVEVPPEPKEPPGPEVTGGSPQSLVSSNCYSGVTAQLP
jgi:hypothetical protein